MEVSPTPADKKPQDIYQILLFLRESQRPT